MDYGDQDQDAMDSREVGVWSVVCGLRISGWNVVVWRRVQSSKYGTSEVLTR